MRMSELFLLAIGLSMDAFAVSVCKGLAAGCGNLNGAAAVGAWFGGFQALMPLIGWILGSQFAQYITTIDHWIAFILLLLIGGGMIREGFSDKEEDASLAPRIMAALAVATSIDALAVGVTFAFLKVSILPAVCFIGAATFVLSAAGYYAGSRLGGRCRRRAEMAGGVILILIGSKILLEHLGILSF